MYNECGFVKSDLFAWKLAVNFLKYLNIFMQIKMIFITVCVYFGLCSNIYLPWRWGQISLFALGGVQCRSIWLLSIFAR